MDKRSTNYRDRLRSELVAASRWLHREHQGVRAPSGALREPHRRRRFSVGNTLGIALAAGVAALLVVLGTGTQRAGQDEAAGWPRQRLPRKDRRPLLNERALQRRAFRVERRLDRFLVAR